jgi:uncharacterized protein (TIGR02996 family)
MRELQLALEQALVAAPDDLAAHHAYADYLQEQGDPRGELIAVQLALEDEARPPAERKPLQEREAALLAQHSREWLGTLAPFVLDQEGVGEWAVQNDRGHAASFARGWVDSLRLFEITSETARALREAPPTLRLLRHLYIRESELDDPGLEELVACPYLGNLRSFQLGPEGSQTHTDGASAVQLIAKMPRLEELRLFAHGVDTRALFAMPLPHLRVLYVHHLHIYPLEVLAANSTLGNLTRLACWAHALEPRDAAAYITFHGARALFHSPHLARLTHLQLRQSDVGDEGCEEIVRSGLLERLQTLDLTGGCVTDAGARTLAACPALRRLKKLTLTANGLTPAGVAALDAVGILVEAGGQFDEDRISDLEYLYYDGDCE